jgi:signal transduction histidine kinase
MIDRAAGWAAPTALALFAVVGAAQSEQSGAVAATVALVVILVGVVISWRGLTGCPIVAALAVPAAGLVVLCHGSPSSLGWFGMCVIAGWAAFGAGLVPSLVAGAVLVAVFVVEWLALGDEPGWGAWIAGTIFTTTACTFGRRQRELVEELREAQAELADRARTDERNRIANEMHDVIGHALTVSLLHVSSAQLALDDDPETARASLAEAERLARTSLDEVRAAVGVMRSGHRGDMAPMPTAADVTALVESFRRAGTTIELDVRGDLHRLNATSGLTVYRIVQESLTNAARHGDRSSVTVQIDVADDDTTVRVLSGGSTRSGITEGSGLVGMRERAEAQGGQFCAGPSPDGWRVEAVLPA